MEYHSAKVKKVQFKEFAMFFSEVLVYVKDLYVSLYVLFKHFFAQQRGIDYRKNSVQK